MIEKSCLTVHAYWDDEAKVYHAASGDIPGLAIEAETLEALKQRLCVVVPELLELNNPYGTGADYQLEVPLCLHTEDRFIARRIA